MTTVIPSYRIELDNSWVDHIVVTAFDAQYGGSNYWLEDAGVVDVTMLGADGDGNWIGLTLWFPLSHQGEIPWSRMHLGDLGGGALHRSASAAAPELSAACTTVLEQHGHTETARQLRLALETPDELPDLDAEASDFIVQLALFGRVIYG